MKVLIVGGGGRENAIAWAASKSKYVEQIFVAPGNAGTAQIAENVNISDKDIRSLASFAEKKGIDLTIIGPETPLAIGIVDYFQRRKLRIFGPTLKAAQIESSKIFSKKFMREYNIPTASYKTFDNPEDAIEFLEKREFPIVIKTDGLAAGKGAIIAKNITEAKDAILHMMIEQNFGQAGKRVVIEEFLPGTEVSLMAITDGTDIVPLVPAMDYKRALDGNLGPNTGGMGAIAPHPLVEQHQKDYIVEHVLKPTVDGLRHMGHPFKGLLYAGVMLTERGPKVLEFNCRFGDPETQVVLPLLKTDFIEMLLYAIEDRLSEFEAEWYDQKALCVVMASGGYPKRYRKGFEITGLHEAAKEATVFHAGTTLKSDKIITNGGRVLGITALGDTLKQAANKTYRAVKHIEFNKSFYRGDIGSPFIKK
ncbi:MAG: phosphoribosylamine--glycine ligase [Candidatus Zixiibacteriota bacterium]